MNPLRAWLQPTKIRRAVVGLWLACMLLGCGCSRWLPEMVPFGAVTQPDYNRSLNGLGAHIKMWQRAGAKVLTPQKLSPKLETMDVIVLVGQSHAPPGLAARDWLENWLAREPGRSVVYFGRDFSADVYYRRRTLDALAANEQSRGEEMLAMRQAAELSDRVQQLPESTFCRWFYLDMSLPTREFTQFAGDWGNELAGRTGTWPVGVVLRPPEASKWRNKKPSWLTAPAPKLKPVTVVVDSDDSESLVVRSTWQAEELDTDEKWNSEFEDLPRSQILLSGADASGSDATPLVVRLTHSRYKKSQILISVNGAPLLNGSLVDPLHQRVGEKIIEQCLPAKRVALLAYNSGGILITDAAEQDKRGLGLEMLTVWPLSAVTMPAALLGIMICAALIPILGRPQSLPRRSVTDFGLHVEAIGRMLLDSRDAEYAKRTIADYFRKVRKETPPAWLDASAELPLPEEPPKDVSNLKQTEAARREPPG